MRALVQRVSQARALVGEHVVGQIGNGLLVYLSVGRGDGPEDLSYVVDKVRQLRIFADEAGKMNLDVGAVGGSVLVISAFTLHGDARKGRRPSFDRAAEPDVASRWYDEFCRRLADSGLAVQRGQFGARMRVESTNEGPVCVLLDSTKVV